jgi:hypothetical protein
MRNQRWETLGRVPGEAPRAEDVVAGELDEDFEPARNHEPIPAAVSAEFGEIPVGPRPDGPDFGDEPHASGKTQRVGAGEDDWNDALGDGSPATERVRPFAALADLPDDVTEAFENLKLVILKHRREAWQALRRDDLIGALDALKLLALAPADEPAPF